LQARSDSFPASLLFQNEEAYPQIRIDGMTSPFEIVMADAELEGLEESDLSLLETLDHLLNSGLVIAGEITISVADIDLIFVGLNVLVSSVEKAHEVLRDRERRAAMTTSSESEVSAREAQHEIE
jgi:Gas vesicle protein